MENKNYNKNKDNNNNKNSNNNNNHNNKYKNNYKNNNRNKKIKNNTTNTKQATTEQSTYSIESSTQKPKVVEILLNDESIKQTYDTSSPSRSLEKNKQSSVHPCPAIKSNNNEAPKSIPSKQKIIPTAKPDSSADSDTFSLPNINYFFPKLSIKIPQVNLPSDQKIIPKFELNKNVTPKFPSKTKNKKNSKPQSPSDSDNRYGLKNEAYVKIFNTENFKDQMGKRNGSAKDVKDLKNLFKKFNAETSVEIDLNLAEIKAEIRKLSRKDFSSYSCLIITIMTHGNDNDILSATDETYNFRQVILEPLLGNPTLLDKPKIFIIQACRGDLACNEVLIETDSVITRSNVKMDTLPTADIFRCYSTFEGRISYRNAQEGSVFIQNFIKVVNQYAETKSISDIMEVVVVNMSSDNRCAQTPVSLSSLRYKFYFGDLMK